MVDGVAFGHHAVGLDRVDVVVSGADTLLGLQQAGGHELQGRRDHHLAGLGSDQQTTLVGPGGDLDHGGFQGSLVQIDGGDGAVGVGAATDQRVVGGAQNLAVAVHGVARAGESLVQQRSRLDLLGVRHGAGQRLGVAAGQRVVQVVFHRLFGDRETHGDGLMDVTGRPCFLRVVVSDGAAFGFHRGLTKAGQLGFFLERAVRRLGLVDFLVLFAVLLVLQAEQCVQTRQKFLEELCTRDSHDSAPYQATPRPAV